MDSFTHALGELDPANRALLDLSLRRGMQAEEIGDLLGTDPAAVIVAREQALEQLATELGMGDVSEIDDVRARLAELPAEAWTPPPPDADGEPERPPLKLVEPEAEGPPRRPEPAKPGRSRLPLLLALLAAAALVLVIVLASSGSGDKTASNAPTPQPAQPNPAAPKPPTPKPANPTPASGPEVTLAAPAGSANGAKATAALAGGGKRLLLNVAGLPDPHGGVYQVWLYNSVIDAHSLTTVKGTRAKLDLQLPANASRWHYIDISLEPGDGNPNHSGQSVLRVPLSKLAG